MDLIDLIENPDGIEADERAENTSSAASGENADVVKDKEPNEFDGFTVPQDLREQAKQLYLYGNKFYEITRKLGIPTTTLHSWKNKYNWGVQPLPKLHRWAAIDAYNNNEQLASQLETAHQLYLQGYRVSDIADALNLPEKKVYTWRREEKWAEATIIQRVEKAADMRLCQLIARENKRPNELAEINTLTQLLVRTTRIMHVKEGGKLEDLNPRAKQTNRKKDRSNKNNDITDEMLENLVKSFEAEQFGYQKVWQKQKDENRIRNIIKSRQIGATYYFAKEALIDAATTGDNQIFLSASKAQAHVFRQYIVQFVQQTCQITLTGDPITLSTGASLYFLGTNSRTAQSYHGHLYLDEYFWVQRFLELRKVASGMAMHKKWRQTYFSTPSTVNHEAYPFWTGQLFNKGKKKPDHIEVDTSHGNLANGQLCDDGQWRQMVTVEDAVSQGCDLFDIDQLKLEYNDSEYQNLLMCQFIDDTDSVFRMTDLQRCMCDSWEAWSDYSPMAHRPMGNAPIWIGYDPSRSLDNAAVIVVAPPSNIDGKYRLLEKISWCGMDFPQQSEEIRQLTKKYNVQYIGIDVSGIGIGVFDLGVKFYPAATAISYSGPSKTRQVTKARYLIHHGLLEYDAGWKDLSMAFMSIHQVITQNNKQMSFQANRSELTGHADLAWATMNALDKATIKAPGAIEDLTEKSIIEIL